MATCEVIPCPKTEADANRVWTEELGPILMQYLNREQERTGETHGVDPMGFMMAWEQGGLRVVLARDDGEVCGFMITNTYTPLYNPFPVMLVDKWMADTDATEHALFDFLNTIIQISGISHVHVVTHAGQRLPDWVNINSDDTYTFKRLSV